MNPKNSMKVNWNLHPSLKRNSFPDRWEISYLSENSNEKSEIIAGDSTFFILESLTPMTKYSVSVKAIKEGFKSKPLFGSVKTAKKAPSQ